RMGDVGLAAFPQLAAVGARAYRVGTTDSFDLLRGKISRQLCGKRIDTGGFGGQRRPRHFGCFWFGLALAHACKLDRRAARVNIAAGIFQPVRAPRRADRCPGTPELSIGLQCPCTVTDGSSICSACPTLVAPVRWMSFWV